MQNEESPKSILRNGVPNQGLTPEIRQEEVVKALRKIKKGKATGPGDIPVEVWQCLGMRGWMYHGI